MFVFERKSISPTLIFICLLSISFFAKTSQAADLGPISDYVSHPDFQSARISPDGAHIAMVVPADDRESLYILDAETRQIKAGFETNKNNGIARYWWANDERIVFTTSINVSGGDQTFLTGNLLALNIDNTKKFALAGPITGERATYDVLNILEDDPEKIMVARWQIKKGRINRSRPEAMVMDIYKKTAQSFSSRVSLNRNSDEVSSPFSWGEIYTDNSANIRIAYASNEAGQIEVKVRQDEEWVDVTQQIGVSDDTAFSVLGYPISFNHDDTGIYHLTLSPQDTIGVALLDIASGQSTMIFSHEKYDVTESGFIFSTDGKDLIGVTVMGSLPETHYFSDHPDVNFNKSLEASLPGYFINFVNFTKDGRKGLAMVSSPTLPPGLFILDRDKAEFTPLFSSRPKLQNFAMNSAEPISFTSRDGINIEGYLTKAVGVEGPAPLIVLVHGGPHGVRDIPIFDSEVKLLTSRGYSVLQVNFRGSGGYGAEFLAMGYRNWGQGMINDIIDGTNYVVEQGLVDSSRMCIMGGSYGGYASLMAVARYPDLYQCAIGVAGVYDLELMNKSDIPFVPGGDAYLEHVIGSDKDELMANSPVHIAENIKVPVLLGVGGKDKRVLSKNSKSLRNKLKANGNEPEWFYISSAGHGFEKPQNREKFYKEVFEFLGRNLK